MRDDEFFAEARDQSLVKSRMVRQYFWAWAKVMLPRAPRIAYIDLFCGPGRYEDGTESTPLGVLRTAIADPNVCTKLAAWFNDHNEQYASALRNEIAALDGVERLRVRPVVTCKSVGTDIAGELKRSRTPSFVFIDPWGYNGLSVDLVNAAVSNWGCDCMFFLNYNRINAALTNPVLAGNMASLFGAERAAELSLRLRGTTPIEREATVIETISQALSEHRKRYVLPFRFRPIGKTSHHLIFVSKNVLGYKIMKDIMHSQSSDAPDGVAAFEYNPATRRQPLLFALTSSLGELGDDLLRRFAGQTVTMSAIYEQHNIGTPFVESNYKDTLKALETQGKISTEPPAAERRRDTFGPNVQVTFPPDRGN